MTIFSRQSFIISDLIGTMHLEDYIHQNKSKVDRNLMGGKAWNLSILCSHNILVPEWICINYKFFEDYLNTSDKKLEFEELLANEMTFEKLIKLKAIIASSKLDIQLPNKFNSNIKFAVRSSANFEDLKSFSFAGQFKTFLYIDYQNIEKKILDCWASLYTENVLYYLKKNKLEIKNLKMSIIVQEMIDSKISGVLFTVDPISKNKNNLRIVAGFGVGEGIVNDLVETDSYIVDKKSSKIIEKVIVEKKKMMKEAIENVPEELRFDSILSNTQIDKLKLIALQIENIYQSPQDIEWAIDNKGEIFITQTRPITTLNEKYIIDNSNIVESFPGVVKPMTWSMVQIVYGTVFNNTIKQLGLRNFDQKIVQNLVTSYRGHIFYHLTNWYKMLGAVPFTRTYIKNWEKMMGIDSSDESNKKNFPSIFNILSPSLNLIKIWVTLDTRLLHLENQITKNVFIPFWKEENRKNIKTISELLNYFEYFKIEIFKEWELTIINDIYAFIFSGLTRHFLLRWHGIEGGSLFNKLLAGVKTMDSVLPLDSLKDLGSHYKDYGEDAQFNVKFKNHLSNYGDRGIAELKLESLTPRENPEILLTLIKEYAQTKNIDKFKENYFNEKKSGLEAEIRIYELLKNNFLKRKILNYLIINTKKTISYREKFRLHRARAYGILRRLVLDIGECLVTENKINEVRDIFYITLDEVQTKNLNLRKIIEHRKNEEKEFLLENVSGRYLVDGNNFSSLINEFDQNKKVHMAKGEPCSSGVIKAIGLVVKTTQELESNPEFIRGKILIAPMTDPGWVFYMTLAAGLIVEKGSILSHTAIIGRELGIPTIVGVKNATEIFKSGELILLNANDGTVEKILNEKE